MPEENPSPTPVDNQVNKGAAIVYDDWGNPVTTIQYEYAVDKKKRKTKRILTYIIAGVWILSSIAIIFGMDPERASTLEEIIQMYMIMSGTVVGAYFGIDSFDHLGKKPNNF